MPILPKHLYEPIALTVVGLAILAVFLTIVWG